MSTTCASCGADVRWTVRVVSGARLILDVEPVPPERELKPGMVVLSPSGESGELLTKAVLAPDAPEAGIIRQRHADGRIFEPHWATCPDAKQWQGRKRSGAGSGAG